MNARKLLGILLVAAGTFALVYRGFNYTSERHTAHLGPIDFEVKEKKRLDVPVWAGVGAVAIGALLLASGRDKR